MKNRIYSNVSEVVNISKLMLATPATSGSSKKVFSDPRQVKTYLHFTMTQSRVNYLLILLVHSDKTDVLSLKDIANDFCGHT